MPSIDIGKEKNDYVEIKDNKITLFCSWEGYELSTNLEQIIKILKKNIRKEMIEFWEQKAKERGYKNYFEPPNVTLEQLWQQAYNEGHLDGYKEYKNERKIV